MYLQGNLVSTLKSVAKQICPSQNASGNGAIPLPRKELTFNRSQQVCKKPVGQPAKGIPTKKVQAVEIFDADDPTNVMIPDELGGAFDHIADKYVNAIASAGPSGGHTMTDASTAS